MMVILLNVAETEFRYSGGKVSAGKVKNESKR
jgi:hypothetical protein